jgi:hypothetical protein
VKRPLASVAVAILTTALSACLADTSPLVLGEPHKTPIPADYKAQIVAWAKRYYVEPASIRGAQISEPIPVRLTSGTELWLVCVELDAAAKGGGYMGPQRVALGIGAGLFLAPLARAPYQLTNAECEKRPLAWRPFPQLEHLGEPASASRARRSRA